LLYQPQTVTDDGSWLGYTFSGWSIPLGLHAAEMDAPGHALHPQRLQDLCLERTAIVHPGSKRYPFLDRVEAVPLASLARSEELFP